MEMENKTEAAGIDAFAGQLTMLFAAQLPPERTPDIVTEQLRLPLPDKITLDATLIRPEGDGAWPVILIRCPYVAVGMMHRSLSAPQFAKRGYAVLVVSVRGTGASEGEWDPFMHEVEDGRAVVDWIAQQPWCDGNIGTFGESYLGLVQLAIADYDHPALKTHYIGVMGANPYHLAYRRGMFRTELWSTWAGQMMGQNRYRMLSPQDNMEIFEKAISCKPAIRLGEELIGEHCDWYEAWVTQNKKSDPLWAEGAFGHVAKVAEQIHRPVFFEGGWFDIFLRAEIEGWNRLPEETRAKSRMLISPRSHTGMAPVPDADRVGMFSIKSGLEWFDYMLKGMDYPHPLGTVETYSMGDHVWKEWKGTIAADRQKTFYLAPADGAAQALSETAPANQTAQMLSETAPAEETGVSFTYDPVHPVESRGGQLMVNNRCKNPDPADPMAGMPECTVDQGAPGERTDVISFVTASLAEDLPMAGSIQAVLSVASDAPATAFTVKVIEVKADGTALNIRDDITDIRWLSESEIRPYTPGEKRTLVLDLCDVCWNLSAGSCLRIDVSSSNFPAYHVHPNVEELWSETEEMRTAHQTVFCGGEQASFIRLPIMEQQ